MVLWAGRAKWGGGGGDIAVPENSRTEHFGILRNTVAKGENIMNIQNRQA